MASAPERWVLGATIVLASGLPLGAHALVEARTQGVADRLTVAGGVPAHIGTIDADLTGAIRLTDVTIGDLVAIDAVEAAVAMGSLVDGELRADEIRVTAPRIALAVDRDGDSPLARLARRLAHHGAPGARGPSRLRRIVVASGSLTVRVTGVGDLTADDLELVPDEGGVRIVAGGVRLHAALRRAAVDVAFPRGAADLILPAMTLGRAIAVGGTGTVTLAGVVATLRDVGAGRLAPAGPLEIRGAIDDDGVPRALSAVIDDAGGWGIVLAGDRVPLEIAAGLAPRGVDLAHAHATGTLALRQSGATLAVSARGSVLGLVIDHPSVAPAPVLVDTDLQLEARIAADSIVLESATASLAAAQISASGWLHRGPTLAAQLDVMLAPAACETLFSAIPATIRGPLDGLGLAGIAGGHARLAIDLAAPDGEGTTLTGAFDGGCSVTTEPPGADVTVLAHPGDQQLADGTHRRMDPADASYSSLAHLPATVVGAFVSAEDGRYWEHHGFDLDQIARSLEIDLREHRLARGGSTISQQLVKNTFLSRRRTLDRKLQEAVLTWRLEARLGKRQILERYLNMLELGPHVFGVHDAARYWFERSPGELGIRQAAFLAALTSQPASMSRRVRHAGGVDPDTADRIAAVLRAMKRDHVITKDAYDAAKDVSLDFAASALAD